MLIMDLRGNPKLDAGTRYDYDLEQVSLVALQINAYIY